jgi:hypothetical protein
VMKGRAFDLTDGRRASLVVEKSNESNNDFAAQHLSERTNLSTRRVVQQAF